MKQAYLEDFKFRGKTDEELKAMDIKTFMELVPSRQRRSLKRGFTDAQKKLLEKIKKHKAGQKKKPVKTHCRDMVVIPEMLGTDIHIHKGKEFQPVKILPEMLGKYLGELTLTRHKVQHSAPGIGATKSSASVGTKAK